MYDVFLADTPEGVAKLDSVVRALNLAADRGEAVGLDTEFYGVNLREKSPVAASVLHVVSVAVRRSPPVITPRGYHVTDAAVLPRAGLDHRGFRDWLEGPAIKVVHNLPVDAHTLKNEGVTLGGGVNTLALARWTWPERARSTGFTLDALSQDLLGMGKTESYREIFREDVQVPVTKVKTVRRCACGEENPGRSHPRRASEGHARLSERREETTYKVVQREIPLEEVVPGHPLFPRLVNYAARDAVLALAVYEIAQNALKKQRRYAPWLHIT